VHRNNILIYIQQDATLHSSFYLETARNVSGGTTTHSTTQTSSNSSTIAADSNNGVTNTDAVDTVVWAPNDGWWYHPKHVEQFPDKLCNVASCWIYIRIIVHLSRVLSQMDRAALRNNPVRWCLIVTPTLFGIFMAPFCPVVTQVRWLCPRFVS